MAQSAKLLIDFRLESVSPDARIFGAHGNLYFNDGDAFRRAARWRGQGLDEFLYRAIEAYLAEV